MATARGAICDDVGCTLPHAGSYVEFEQRNSVVVDTSQPSLVAQFLVGQGYDPNNFAQNGDPDMVLAVPSQQYRSSYTFYTARDFKDGTTAILVVPHCLMVLLDGFPLPPPVETVGGFDIIWAQGLSGSHHLEPAFGNQQFGLTVSGLADFCSYTYPGGLDLTAISPPL
jgi:hypothetical protein